MGRTRGHDFCLKIKRNVNSNIGLNFFTKRVLNYWNQLSDIVEGCISLDAFKMKLDEFMARKGEFKYMVIQILAYSFLLLLLL